MTISDHDYERLSKRVKEAPGAAFSELLRLAELDPLKHLRFADWSGVDFGGDDLQGFDFTGADLKGCRFDGAQIAGARFDLAEVDRTALMKAADWSLHLSSWRSPDHAVANFAPPDLAVFSDAPFAPEMVVIPTGRFQMGSAEDDDSGFDRERPRHEVTLGRRFALGRYPVTVGEYREVMERGLADMPEPGFSKDHLPKTNVSWNEAVAFCEALSERTGQQYRLASEAEWEYACRAGTQTRYPWGDEITPTRANYGDSDTRGPTEVGSYSANDWGLHDMIGNVSEWCADLWHDSYEGAPTDGQIWGANRAYRPPRPARRVLGSPLRGTCARRFATGSAPSSATTASVFAVPEVKPSDQR